MTKTNGEQYLESFDEIKSIYTKTKNWNKVVMSKSLFLHLYINTAALVDYVEEFYGITIENGEHLQKTIRLNKKSIEEIEMFFPIKHEEKAVFDVMLADQQYMRYIKKIEDAIENGAMYQNLFDITPVKFSSINNKRKYPTNNQYDTIIMVIGNVFKITSKTELYIYPNLRVIAKEMNMPYSVAMDIFEATK